MKHYGHEPPWADRYSRYGWWERGAELFDGGWVWYLRAAESTFAQMLFRLPTQRSENFSVEWLDDTFLPRMGAQSLSAPVKVKVDV